MEGARASGRRLDYGALPVQGGGIVESEEDIEDVLRGDERGVVNHLWTKKTK